jgi:hypothetical protein
MKIVATRRSCCSIFPNASIIAPAVSVPVTAISLFGFAGSAAVASIVAKTRVSSAA